MPVPPLPPFKRAMVAMIAIAVFSACHPSPAPAPMPPDASDAAPPPAADAGPSSACFSACAILAAFCGPAAPTCPMALAEAERDRLIRQQNGQPLTCACIAGAKSKADIDACGIACLGTTP